MNELIERLVLQIEQYIHNQKRDEIVQRIQETPTAETLGQIAHDLVMSMEQQAANQSIPLDLDVIVAVATEVIDMLVEIAEAMGVEMKVEEMREEALLHLVLAHMEAVQDDPEAKAAAEEMLAAMADEGMLDQSMGYIEKRANSSSEEMRAAGEQMLASRGPARKPVAAGVQQGLMGG